MGAGDSCARQMPSPPAPLPEGEGRQAQPRSPVMSSTAVFTKASPLDALQRWLPKLVLAPSMLIIMVGFYGYILWTFVLSFTSSRFMPSYSFVGLQQYVRLLEN